MGKHHINEFHKTGFANNGRAAGIGMAEDDYSDTSFPDHSADGVRPNRWHNRRPILIEAREQGREEEPVLTYFIEKEDAK